MAVHSPAPRRKRAPDKRARILKAAIKVFAKNGFYATRVSEIAKAAGVADGTIYLYFKNKDDVLVTIFEEGIERLLTILREVAESEEPFENRIQRIIELQLGLMEEQRDLAEVITSRTWFATGKKKARFAKTSTPAWWRAASSAQSTRFC
ncbi:MAG: TetR/AcrR family transcriptional regulator [Deltaproteobacteria bacterium]|nr:TetR/AcrR family transcriptional regulator [Deltaproteobacteria bacterium]